LSAAPPGSPWGPLTSMTRHGWPTGRPGGGGQGTWRGLSDRAPSGRTAHASADAAPGSTRTTSAWPPAPPGGHSHHACWTCGAAGSTRAPQAGGSSARSLCTSAHSGPSWGSGCRRAAARWATVVISAATALGKAAGTKGRPGVATKLGLPNSGSHRACWAGRSVARDKRCGMHARNPSMYPASLGGSPGPRAPANKMERRPANGAGSSSCGGGGVQRDLRGRSHSKTRSLGTWPACLHAMVVTSETIGQPLRRLCKLSGRWACIRKGLHPP